MLHPSHLFPFVVYLSPLSDYVMVWHSGFNVIDRKQIKTQCQ